MSFIKRLCSLLIMSLLLISIYKDLNKPTPLAYYENRPQLTESTTESYDFSAIEIKVEQGDTLLSITEGLNEQQLTEINMDIIIKDFKSLNTSADPYNLLMDTFYLFPLYVID